jgi:Flp pilus assembly protein TadB
MDNLDDLKALWHTAKIDNLPTAQEVKQLSIKFRRQHVRKKRLIIIGAIITALLMIGVMLVYHARLTTTWIGEVLIIGSCVALVFDNNKAMRRFNELDDCSNKEFVAFIEKTRQNQIQYYKRKEYLIMLPACVGWLMYLYEVAMHWPGFSRWVYVGAVVYLLVIWFWVRPYYFKKNAKKLNTIEERLKNISKQLE